MELRPDRLMVNTTVMSLRIAQGIGRAVVGRHGSHASETSDYNGSIYLTADTRHAEYDENGWLSPKQFPEH
jgi:hypothetical protein